MFFDKINPADHKSAELDKTSSINIKNYSF